MPKNLLSNIKKRIIVGIFVSPFIFKERLDFPRSQIVVFHEFFNLHRGVEFGATRAAVVADDGNSIIVFWKFLDQSVVDGSFWRFLEDLK